MNINLPSITKNRAYPLLGAYLICFILATPLLASAHELRLTPEVNGNLLIQFGDIEEWDTVLRDRLFNLEVITNKEVLKKDLAFTRQGKNMLSKKLATPNQAMMVTAQYDNGFWVGLPNTEGKLTYVNTTKAMLPQATYSEAALKFAKALYTTANDNTVYKHVANHLLEIIPQQNPAIILPSQMLTVLVKFNGIPLANKVIELADSSMKDNANHAKYKTNGQGLADIRLINTGLNVIYVEHEAANNAAMGKAINALPAETISMIATYSFQTR